MSKAKVPQPEAQKPVRVSINFTREMLGEIKAAATIQGAAFQQFCRDAIRAYLDALAKKIHVA